MSEGFRVFPGKRKLTLLSQFAQPHRHGVVEDQEGQHGERHDRGFGTADSGDRMQDEAMDAATSTMQMAMKIVEMRIMSRATPSRPNCHHPGKHGSFGRVRFALSQALRA